MIVCGLCSQKYQWQHFSAKLSPICVATQERFVCRLIKKSRPGVGFDKNITCSTFLFESNNILVNVGGGGGGGGEVCVWSD